MRALIYVRISRDREGRETGIERQEEDCRRLAKSRGWEVLTVLADNDLSASSGKRRPQWEAVLGAIERGEADALIAYSSSRMYRRPADLQRLVALVKARRGFQIATVASGTIDVESAQGRMVAGILAEVDQAEVEVMAERIARARKQRTEAGLDAGGSRPFGYDRIEGGRLVVREAEAMLIREAGLRFLQGWPVRRILRDWEDRGIQTPKGNRWRPVTFRHMLRNPRLAGIHPETGERAEWPPVIDRRTHLAIVERYADPTRTRSNRGERWLLTGLLFCSKCGGRMTARASYGSRRYTCDATSRAHLSIAADPVEILVVDEATEVAPNYDAPTVKDPSEALPLLAKLDELDRRIEELVSEGAAAGLRARDIAAGTGRLRAERDEVESQMVELHPAPEQWSMLSADRIATDTRAWLESVIDRIVIHPVGSATGRRFHPDRDEIIWR